MIDIVRKNISELLVDKKMVILPEMPLIGDDRLLDSLNLVELCLRLEDAATEMGFQFDWTSEEAMSRRRGMFRSVAALSDEFEKQMRAQA